MYVDIHTNEKQTTRTTTTVPALVLLARAAGAEPYFTTTITTTAAAAVVQGVATVARIFIEILWQNLGSRRARCSRRHACRNLVPEK